MSQGIKKCKDIDVQRYEHGVGLTLPYKSKYQQQGATVDKCLVDEIVDLWYNKHIHTLGCCCGHDKQQAYIQVEPEYCQQMLDLGYVQLPADEHGNGQWCFKPKTILKYQKVVVIV